MRKSIWIWALVAALCASPAALAQDGGDSLAQMPLTDALVQQFLSASPDIDMALKAAPPAPADSPDPAVASKLEQIAKAHKFANFGEFDTVAGNVMLVLQGVDPDTRRYIGAPAELKREIAALQANKQIPAEDKKAEIDELNDELKAVTPVKFKGNIALVLKYYDKLQAMEGEKP